MKKQVAKFEEKEKKRAEKKEAKKIEKSSNVVALVAAPVNLKIASGGLEEEYDEDDIPSLPASQDIGPPQATSTPKGIGPAEAVSTPKKTGPPQAASTPKRSTRSKTARKLHAIEV